MKSAKIGDRVAHAASFLQSIGGDKEIADMRGTIVEVIPAKKVFGSVVPARAKIKWDDEDEIKGALLCNLSKISDGKTKGIAEGIILE